MLLIKILLIGYLYGIKSKRLLEEEINKNLAYRYYCRLNLDVKAPDHSTFSQNHKRRFTDSKIFRDIFNEIIIKLIEKKLVTGENVVSDGTFIPGNISNSSTYKITEENTSWKSITDLDCGYIDHEHKQGMGYISEMTVDTENGIVICACPYYPAIYRNRQRFETSEYKKMKRLRGIWAEGSFAAQKREHNLSSVSVELKTHGESNVLVLFTIFSYVICFRLRIAPLSTAPFNRVTGNNLNIKTR